MRAVRVVVVGKGRGGRCEGSFLLLNAEDMRVI